MARRQVTDCDRCGKRDIDPITLRLQVGWDNDPAGGAKTADVHRPDVCPSCAAAILNGVLKNLSFEASARVHEEIKSYRRTIGVAR